MWQVVVATQTFRVPAPGYANVLHILSKFGRSQYRVHDDHQITSRPVAGLRWKITQMLPTLAEKVEDFQCLFGVLSLSQSLGLEEVEEALEALPFDCDE